MSLDKKVVVDWHKNHSLADLRRALARRTAENIAKDPKALLGRLTEVFLRGATPYEDVCLSDAIEDACLAFSSAKEITACLKEH